MEHVYDFANLLTKTLSKKVTEISKDDTLEYDVKIQKMKDYDEMINIITGLVNEVIQRGTV